MKFLSIPLSAFLFLATSSVLYAAEKAPLTVTTDLMSAAGEKVGTATLTEAKEGVQIAIQAEKLTPGQHGIHFHEKGLCTAPDFKSAGDHFGSKVKQHGLENPKGPHYGDLPNLEVKEDGTVSTEMTSKTVTLKKGKNSLFKSGGTAIVIHAKADDQKSNPSGNSGDRAVCGVIQKPKKAS